MSGVRMRRITGSKKRKAYIGDGGDGDGDDDGCENEEEEDTEEKKGNTDEGEDEDMSEEDISAWCSRYKDAKAIACKSNASVYYGPTERISKSGKVRCNTGKSSSAERQTGGNDI
jgi:hypothetical protein